MKKLWLLVILICGLMLELHKVLQNGELLSYLDSHPNALVIPQVEYSIGSTYYLFHDLEMAATYYTRIPARYPNSPLADDAYWAYLQTLDDSPGTSRTFLAEEYSKYLERFPKGDHVENVRTKLDGYSSGVR